MKYSLTPVALAVLASSVWSQRRQFHPRQGGGERPSASEAAIPAPGSTVLTKIA